MNDEKTYFLVAGSESDFPVNVSDIQYRFVERLQSYFPNNPVTFVELKDVREGLFRGVHEAKEVFPDAAFISLSSLYFHHAEFQIGANRLVDTNRHPIGLGARPRLVSLKKQVDKVLEKLAGRSAVVVDDTLFHGDTLSTLIAMGIPVVGAVEYFSSLPTMEKFEAKGIRIFTAVGLNDYLDVMPLHDFLPPLPLCGKVLGEVTEDGNLPVIKDGISFSVPYLMPWITADEMEIWSSIPAAKAANFSEFAIRQSIEIMERFWGQGFSTIEYASKHQPLRTSVPFMKNQKDEYNVSIPIMLTRYLHMLEQESV